MNVLRRWALGMLGFRARPAESRSYHDLHITTAEIPRTSIFNLPYGIEVSCTRVAGWQVWSIPEDRRDAVVLGGEYNSPKWLVLDVAGHVIVDSRRPAEAEQAA